MDARSWIEEYARALGMPAPSADEQKVLLSLASVAANASERLAAPISCWMVALSGRSPTQGLALARQLAESATPSTGTGGPAQG